MKKIFTLTALVASMLGLGPSANAQWVVTTAGVTNDTVTFDASFAGVNNGVFAGTGFESAPMAGQLNSNAWAFTGLSDGNTMFGGSYNTGDYAKGGSAGGEFGGGIYAWEVAPGDTAMGVQPTGSDFTPGEMHLRVVNGTGGNVSDVDISYTIWVNNDATRANSFDLKYSVNGGAAVAVIGAEYTSVEASQGSVLWVDTNLTLNIPVSLLAGDTIDFIWSSQEVSGSGSRDEFALDNIGVAMTAGTASTPPVLGFNSTSTDVNEMDTTFNIEVELVNSNAMPVSFVVNYDTANSTATNGVDVDFTPVMVTIPANTDSVVALPFTVNQDAIDEGMMPEEAIIYIAGAMNADLMDSVHTVTIMDDDYVIPTYDIATVRTVDSAGVLDSAGVYCKLEGIVYGKNLFSTGRYSFTIHDGTAGINAYTFSSLGSFTVNQGDEIRVIGEVGQYRGLAQIEIDSVVVLSTGNCIEYHSVVEDLNEETESEPISFIGVTLVDPMSWPSAGSDANMEFVTAEGDTLMMRIDKETMIADSITSAPMGQFNLIGIGGQFDFSAPYDEGYQIFPMFVSDFDTVPSTVSGLYINEVLVDNQSVEMDPEGDYDSWVEIYNSNGTDMDMTGMFMYSEGAEMPYRFPRCEAAVVVPANGWAMLWADDENMDGAMHLPFTLDAADTIYIYNKDAMVVDSLGWDSSVADVSFGHRQDGNMEYVSFEQPTPNASNNGGVVLSVISALEENALSVYPNPVSTGKVNFNKVVDVKVYSLTGTLVANRTNVKSINVSNFEKGIYIVETNEGEIVKMIVE